MACYQIENLTFFYPEKQIPALNKVSVTVNSGEFVVLCGHSGCGKSTLLRQLKPLLSPHGRKTGEILFRGADISSLDQKSQSIDIGFVMQSHENQIVTDKVWHELAFGLESLGESTPVIRARVAEMASFFGIQNWFYKSVTDLSGGQKQLLNLASVMVMQPSVLILDEPTSQLDPIAASEFIATIGRIHRELGVTVIMTEHRLDDVLPLCDRVLVMEDGKIISDGTPETVGKELKALHHDMFSAFPTPMKIWSAVENDLPCPITVKDGREWLNQITDKRGTHICAEPENSLPEGEPVIELRDVFFKYDNDLPDVLNGMSLSVYKSEIYALVGGNGAGKTTALSVIADIVTPQSGDVRVFGKTHDDIPYSERYDGLIGILPQNPQALFIKKTLNLDLYEMLSGRKLDKAERDRRVSEVSELCELTDLLDSHPYDLSGGEQQRAALAKILLLSPKLILLDEPAKGMDAQFKQKFASLLRSLTASGVTIFMVSHDIEFCAEYCDRVAMCFDGNIVSEGSPKPFFAGNNFYTTSASRTARAHFPQAATANDVISALGGTAYVPAESALPANKARNTDTPLAEKYDILPPQKQKRKRRIPIIIAAAVLFVLTCIYVQWQYAFFTIIWDGGFSLALSSDGGQAMTYVLFIVLLCAELIALIIECFPGMKTGNDGYIANNDRKLSKRTLAAMVMVFIAIPLTIYIGVFYFGDRKYYFISLLIILETMLPFILAFEGRKPQARELLIIAALCAIAVAGRAALFMLPHFKPMIAVTIIAGVAFGGETGFLVGAMSGFTSNFFFGQGPWTPWQMFAYGIIGFIAGILFKKGLISRNRVALSIFGGIAAFIIYGGIMNPASVLMYQATPNAAMFWFAYLRGAPLDLVHAVATVFFLMIGSAAMLEKLDRIKIKYGLIEV